MAVTPPGFVSPLAGVNIAAEYNQPATAPVVKSPLAGTNIASALSQPSFTQPDWSGLLNTYMQPYQSIYDVQMAALQKRIGAQTQLANQRFTGSDTSTMARLADEHSELGRRIVNTLAAQGLFDSGGRRFQQAQEALRYKRAETDASNQLLDYLTGLQNSLADAQFQGQLGLANQRLQTASTLGSLYQPTVNPSPLSGLFPSANSGVPQAQPAQTPFSTIFQKAYAGG